MQKIYARANNVIIWLGQGNQSIEEAMDRIPELTEKLDGFNGRLGFKPDVLAAHDLPALGSPVWLGLSDLLSHSWFTRVWVFQEAVLAKETWIMCGRKTVAFEVLAAFATKLVSSSASGLIRRNPDGQNIAVTRGAIIPRNCTLQKMGFHRSA